MATISASVFASVIRVDLLGPNSPSDGYAALRLLCCGDLRLPQLARHDTRDMVCPRSQQPERTT
jgi:hypothetical protein